MIKPGKHSSLNGLPRFLLRSGNYVLIYIVWFIILMRTDRPAVNEDGGLTYSCSFRFSNGIPDASSGITKMYAEESIWNVIFYPVELAWKFATDR
jgi:hypothetical protein